MQESETYTDAKFAYWNSSAKTFKMAHFYKYNLNWNLFIISTPDFECLPKTSDFIFLLVFKLGVQIGLHFERIFQYTNAHGPKFDMMDSFLIQYQVWVFSLSKINWKVLENSKILQNFGISSESRQCNIGDNVMLTSRQWRPDVGRKIDAICHQDIKLVTNIDVAL